MASSCDNKIVHIISINEQLPIKTLNVLDSVDKIAFINSAKCLALYNHKKKYFHIVDMDFPRFEDKKKTASSIKFNIFR